MKNEDYEILALAFKLLTQQVVSVCESIAPSLDLGIVSEEYINAISHIFNVKVNTAEREGYPVAMTVRAHSNGVDIYAMHYVE